MNAGLTPKRDFMTKNGYAIMKIASELLIMKEGGRIPRINDFSKKMEIGHGTVQNALKYIEDNKGVKLESQGHQGTFIKFLDRKKLWDLSGFKSVLGTMPLPYSKRYEGLATGLYESFEAEDIQFNLAYIRGAEVRFEGLLQNRYDFVVSSRFSAQEVMKRNNSLEIATSLGKYSYVGGHTILFRDGIGSSITEGMRVGIDPKSLDQSKFTKKAFEGKQVEFITMPYNQLIPKLQKREIDATVWNADEVAERYQFLAQVPLKLPEYLNSCNIEAVIVVNKSNHVIKKLLTQIINIEKVKAIQDLVFTNKQAPRY